MILSMTGLGLSAAEGESFQGSATIRSVNHRFLDLGVRLSHALAPLEAEIRQRVQASVRRGRVEVTVRGENRDAPTRVVASEPLVRGVVAALRQIGQEHGLAGGVALSDVAHFPGCLEVVEDGAAPADGVRREVLALVEQALAGLDQMRRAEGARLESILIGHLELVSGLTETIARAAEASKAQRCAALSQRVRELQLELPLDEPRLYQEIARLVDRADVYEELVRLRGHVQQAREAMAGTERCGRQLDFLAQEMTREANTIGSKSPSGEVGRAVIDLKTEIERFREQVQNVE